MVHDFRTRLGCATFQDHDLLEPDMPRTLPRLLLAGPSRCGKGTMADWLHKHTPLVYAGSMSSFLVPHVLAETLRITCEQASGPEYAAQRAALFMARHENKAEFKRVGNVIRDVHAGVLVDDSLKAGDLVEGPRDPREFVYCREQKKVDLLVWIDNPRVPEDFTLEASEDDCDVTIRNASDIESFYRRIAALCRALRVPFQW